MTVRRLLPLAPVLTLALFILSPVLAQAGIVEETTGACCTGLVACSEVSVGACDGLGGAYQGDDTACTPGACGTVPPLNHFQCYDVRRQAFEPVTLNLTDDFGTSTATVRRAKMLCAPVNKNDEDQNAPDDADHLVGYEIRRSDRFAGVLDEAVDDQFGSLVLDIRRPERILVPSAKQADPNDVVTPLDPPAIDHYQCYRVRGDRRRVAGVTVEDQFGTGTADVKKPSRLCLPVDKNGEGIVDPAARLMCYAIKPGPRVNTTVQVNNQLGDDELRVKRARELCVPVVVPCPCLEQWENGAPGGAPPLASVIGNGCNLEEASPRAQILASFNGTPQDHFYGAVLDTAPGSGGIICTDETTGTPTVEQAIVPGGPSGVAACARIFDDAGCGVPSACPCLADPTTPFDTVAGMIADAAQFTAANPPPLPGSSGDMCDPGTQYQTGTFSAFPDTLGWRFEHADDPNDPECKLERGELAAGGYFANVLAMTANEFAACQAAIEQLQAADPIGICP